MAERRMFAKTIIDSDAFLDMSLTTQALYFHLSMRADDDGFLNNPQKIMRMVGCNKNDFDVLIAKNFIITFDTGVIVIKHWKIHNYIRKDRYNGTVYQEEKSMLSEKENGAYSLETHNGIPLVNHSDTQMDTQVRLGKDRLGKVNNKEGEKSTRFVPPTIEDVKAYCTERKNSIDAETFIDFYSAKGWLIGKTKMKDWKACVRTWEKKEKPKAQAKPNKFNNFPQRSYDYENLEKQLLGGK